MMAGEKLVSLMLDAGKSAMPNAEKVDLMYGKVMSIAPLKVQVVNEPKLVLTEEFLILSPLCKQKLFEIPTWYTNTAESHAHTIPKHPEVEVWRGLEVGDIVLMLRILRGSKFYLLQREGDL